MIFGRLRKIYRLMQTLRRTSSYQNTIIKKIGEIIEDLGPLYIKLAQLASTRADIFSPNIIKAFCLLKENAPAVPYKDIEYVIENDLNIKLEDFFSDFEHNPIGSASIAQVHGATLFNGKKVAIKVIKPGIRKKIKQDLKMIKVMIKVFGIFSRQIRKLKLYSFLEEFEQSILQELDLTREAANISYSKHLLGEISNLIIPEIHWGLSSKNVLVMQRISGDTLTQAKLDSINTNKVVKTLFKVLFYGALEHGFFHADLHSGNILVEKNTISLIDFGMVGILNDKDRQDLKLNFAALFKRDYYKVAQLHIRANWISGDIKLEKFADELRILCEPIFAQPYDKISFADTLFALLKVTNTYSINLQPQFFLLQKSLYNLEGICRTLDPNINVWQICSPIFEEIMSPRSSIKKTKDSFANMLIDYKDITIDAKETIKLLKNTLIKQQYKRNSKDVQKIAKAILGCTLFFSLIAIYWQNIII